MSGRFLLDFSALAISLFNTLVLAWLGLTVLFNAERRAWGMYLAVGGLLAGAAFFLSHSIILSGGTSGLLRSFSAWWQVGWVLVIAAPYAWFLLMLWYSGFWEAGPNSLRRRQSIPFGVSLAYTCLLAGLLLVANPLAGLSPDAYLEGERRTGLGGLPLIILAYPPYILICIGLALDALLHPAPSGRVMGDLARGRARPWLIGASLTLLLVSLLVGALFIWLAGLARARPVLTDLVYTLSIPLSVIDLILAILLMGAVLLMGQAVVSYEIFTGKTLPRRGLLSRWRSALLMFAGLSLIAAWSLTSPLPRVYAILALLLLAALAYALFNWQSYAEREAGIRQLRPFVSSGRLFESMLAPAEGGAPQEDLLAPFAPLCGALGARRAALVPAGPLAALRGAPLFYPPGEPLELPPLAGLFARFTSPHSLGLPLDPARCGGLVWASPLWSERGLTGILLLGEKTDGGFYSLEEIEIARSSGERLADLLASAELARRLMALQRQRLAESGILDRRTRRVLHDDVLPRLHTALLQMSGAPQGEPSGGQETQELLAAVHRQVSALLRELPAGPDPQVTRLGLVEALHRMIETELPNGFDEVVWEVEPEAEARARDLPALTAEVVYHAAREAVRNAARHARPSGDSRRLRLSVVIAWRDGLELRIEDNGVGLPPPGSPSQGTGQGLALHGTLMAVIQGALALESAPGEYTRVILTI